MSDYKITHSILVDDAGVLRTDVSCIDYSGLAALRTMTPPNITRTGRLPNLVMNFSLYKQSDYDMRKKAETLQHRKNQTPFSRKSQYSQVSKNGSYFYSSQGVLQRIESRLVCPNLDLIVRPPTNSGIRDYTFPGYYLNNNVPLILPNNNLNS
jgi:hypothetical protein